MPVHNGARFLRPAIDSVLAQTFRDFELLVVDDDSSDESVAIARHYSDARVRSLSGHGRHGLSGTLNIGLNAATGQYLARLDHDDVAHPDRIARQVAFLDRRPDVALVGSLARLVDEDTRDIGTVKRPLSAVGIRWYSLVENPLIHSSVMFRLDVARGLGGYDASLAYAEDFDLWSRILERHAVENLDEHLVSYRRWSSSKMSAVEEDADNPRRQQLHGIMAALIKRRVDAELGEPLCSDGDAALLSMFTLGVTGARRREFLELLTRLRSRFENKWRDAVATPDYWRTVADQYDATAFRLSPPSRLAAAGVYWHACVHAPKAASRLSWTRAAAMLTLGKRGRQRAASAWAAK